MPLSLEEYLARPPEAKPSGTPCSSCGTPLQTVVTGRNPTPTGPLCDDCCFDALGALVEAHPVGRITRTYGA